MDMIFAILGLILAIWSIRSICIKQQSIGKKVGKSVFSAWYFLTAAGLAVSPSDSVPISIIMMMVGAFVVWYCNRNYKAPTNNNDILSGHADAVRDFDLASNKNKPSKYRSVNHAKGKDAEIKNVAFSYVNSKGESSFRDVDVKSFDGEYVEGYCHLSRKFKTFRLDRIDGDIVIRDTGEAMNSFEWAAKMEG
ncbi:WYL domain-containing protein [Pantoea sp. DY-15]|uniref:WYL domain-containing protein n=1 Tax=Pantoea sp. DY-15 TaxID=2871489 RepID=UPI001C96275D|nr:WYL domain-containing protein [Pantoea sp. DY-15]MBY4887641.1 WYL domain-containing protein [Pantoea sp. DY-15]